MRAVSPSSSSWSIIIIGILLAIAVPSYMSFRSRANDSAAKANVRAAIPAVEAFFADNNTYAGITVAGLQSAYDQGIKNITMGPRARRPRRTASRASSATRRGGRTARLPISRPWPASSNCLRFDEKGASAPFSFEG